MSIARLDTVFSDVDTQQGVGSVTITQEGSYSAEGVEVEYVTGGTEVAMLFAIDVSEIKALWFYSTVTGTFSTNSIGAPADTIDVVGGVPFFWDPDSALSNPLGTDVTQIFFTLSDAGDSPASVSFGWLKDIST